MKIRPYSGTDANIKRYRPVMKFEEYNEKLILLHKLILHANTGTPAELAKKLHVSERTARRLVEKLKASNKSITYSRKANSYIST